MSFSIILRIEKLKLKDGNDKEGKYEKDEIRMVSLTLDS